MQGAKVNEAKDKLLCFLALKVSKKRKRPDRRTCPADSKEVYFKLQFIRPLTFARRYATIVEPKKAKDGGKKLNQSF